MSCPRGKAVTWLFMHSKRTGSAFYRQIKVNTSIHTHWKEHRKLIIHYYLFWRKCERNNGGFLFVFGFSCVLNFGFYCPTHRCGGLQVSSYFLSDTAPFSKCGCYLNDDFPASLFHLAFFLCSFQEAECAYTLFVVAIFWLTEALPLSVTALLPGLMFPLFGIMTSKNVSPLASVCHN